MKKLKCFLLITILLVSLSLSATELKIALYESPPFVMEDVNGSYTGLIIDIWETIAKESNIEYKYIPYHESINNVIDDISEKNYDLALGSITMNSDRMVKTNFSPPFYITDTCIAANISENNTWNFISNIFSLTTLRYILALAILLLFMALIFWTIERKNNPQFNPIFRKGIFDAYYFSAVVMTTVGFGDKTPISDAAKIVTILWMFISLGITGVFIGNISSSITVNRLDSGINDIAALNRTKVGSMINSTSDYYLNSKHVKFVGYDNVEEGLNDIANGKLETFVYDTPVMKYYIEKHKLKITLSDIRFDMQYYAIPMNLDPELEQVINRKILEYLRSDRWEKTLNKYNLN